MGLNGPANKARTLIAFAFLLIFMPSLTAWGAPNALTIKVATLAPQGSEWHRILQEMGDEWQKGSKGRIAFRLYPGGVAGDDLDLVRKMRLGTLDAGLLTLAGLSAIDRGMLALEVPLAYADTAELDCVSNQMSSQLEKQMEAKGFMLLGWSEGGWTHFFTKTPVKTPEDMKKMKVFVWAGDDQYTELWKRAGFNPVPLPSTEISTALQTGLVTAVSSNLQGALLLQWYKQVPYMTDLKWAMLLGGIVISKATWEKLPADLRPLVKESALKACNRLRDFSRQSESKDLEVLQKNGVKIVHVEGQVLEEWRKLIAGVLPQVRGAYLPAETMDTALKLRDKCRQAGGKTGK
ncbi:MAG: TRAP transporter substrate-binding protein DctP [Desulfobacteraceae bacterium]|nr:TRAP transporter substrate-binding protein DctP [Desulfobacteraceae bacterium]